MKTLKLLISVTFAFLLTTSLPGGPEQAKTMIGWLENGVYLDAPDQVVGDLIVPRIDMGPTVWHPKLKESEWKYWYDLERQANFLACTGSNAIPQIIEGLSSGDFYVRVISALALDKMMGLKHSDYLRVQGNYLNLDTMKQTREPVDAALIQLYRERFSKLYPGLSSKQNGTPAGSSRASPRSDNKPETKAQTRPR